MSCNKIEAWLDNHSLSDATQLPGELKEHMNNCAECRETFAAATFFRSAAGSIRPSENARKRAWNGVKNNLPAARAAEIAAQPTLIEKFKELLAMSGFKPALAFSLVVLVAVGMLFWRPATPESTAGKTPQLMVASVTGTNASVRIGLEEKQLNDQAVFLPENAVIIATVPQAQMQLNTPDGSRVDIAGKCMILLNPDGFSVKYGDFTGDFTLKQGARQRIAVPGAFLNVVGTKIKFLIENNQGSLDLLEGSVDVETSSGLNTFGWHAGTRLTIKDGKIADYPVEIPAEPKTNPVSHQTPDPVKPVDAPIQTPAASQGKIIDIDNIIKDH